MKCRNHRTRHFSNAVAGARQRFKAPPPLPVLRENASGIGKAYAGCLRRAENASTIFFQPGRHDLNCRRVEVSSACRLVRADLPPSDRGSKPGGSAPAR